MKFRLSIFFLSLVCILSPGLLSGAAGGTESNVNTWLQVGARAPLIPAWRLGLYGELGSAYNWDRDFVNHRTEKWVDQPGPGFYLNETAVGPTWNLNLSAILPGEADLDVRLLYRLRRWNTEESAYYVQSFDQRSLLSTRLLGLNLRYRNIFWYKLPFRQYEALYQLKNPAVDPDTADQDGQYYIFDYKKVDYEDDLWNRHMVGVGLPFESLFGFFGMTPPAFLRDGELFFENEFYFNLTAWDNNEFKGYDQVKNIYGDYIDDPASFQGYNENFYFRNRLYGGMTFTPASSWQARLSYIFESNFYYSEFNPRKLSADRQRNHIIRLRLVYAYGKPLMGENIVEEPQPEETEKTEEGEPAPEAEETPAEESAPVDNGAAAPADSPAETEPASGE